MPLGYSGAPRVTQNNQASRTRRLSRSLVSGNNGTPLVMTLFSNDWFQQTAAPVAANTAAIRPVHRIYSTNPSFAGNSAVDIGYWQNAGYISLKLMNTGATFFTIGYPGLANATANSILFVNASGSMSGNATKLTFDEANTIVSIIDNSSSTVSRFKIAQSSTGDAGMLFALTSTDGWTLGIDNSDTDKFKLCHSNTLGTNNYLVACTNNTIGIMGDPSGVRIRFNLVAGTEAGGCMFIDSGGFGFRMVINDALDSLGSHAAFRHQISMAAGESIAIKVGTRICAYTHTSTNAWAFGRVPTSVNTLLTARDEGNYNRTLLLEQMDSAADCSLSFWLSSPDIFYSMGIDNSDGDKLKLAASATIGSNDGMVMTTGHLFGFGVTPASDTKVHILKGTSDTVPGLLVEQTGTGDTALRFLLASAVTFSIGLDNSDNDLFKISGSSALGTTDLVVANSTMWGIKITPTSTHHVEGSIARSIATVSANTTLNSTHYSVLVNASAGAITITLPAVATCIGRLYQIKKIDATANAVTIDGDGAENVEFAANTVLAAQGDGVIIQNDGSAWYIMANV